jgi:mycothiol system anti-sigma-R factor
MSAHSCREALERVFEYLDNELPAADAAEIKRHFEKCRSCFPALQFCQSFRDAMHRAAGCQGCAPTALREKIAEILKQ